MDKIVIIGNGFDIAHGIPTMYSDFRRFVANRYPGVIDKRDKTRYIENLEDIDEQEFAAEILLNTMDQACGLNWSNFEEALAYIEFSSKYPKPSHKENETVEEDNDLMKNYLLYMDMITGIFIACSRIWKEFFTLWIREVQINIKIVNYQKKVYLREFFKDENILYLSFNYTKTLKKLYGIKNIFHIHNYVGQDLIFGHGEDEPQYDGFALSSSFLDEMVMGFKKNTDLAQIRTKKFFKSLDCNINRVYSYGFSYGDVDSVYIKRIVKSISEDSIWYFTKFEAMSPTELSDKQRKLRSYGFNGRFDVW